MAKYTIKGFDAYGLPVTEEIDIPHVPIWKRMLRAVYRFVGFGGPRFVSSIKVESDQ